MRYSTNGPYWLKYQKEDKSFYQLKAEIQMIDDAIANLQKRKEITDYDKSNLKRLKRRQKSLKLKLDGN